MQYYSRFRLRGIVYCWSVCVSYLFAHLNHHQFTQRVVAHLFDDQLAHSQWSRSVVISTLRDRNYSSFLRNPSSKHLECSSRCWASTWLLAMLSSYLSGLISFACLHLCCAFPCYRQTLTPYRRHQTWFFYIGLQWSSTPSTLYLRQAIGCTSLLDYQGQPLSANAIARIQSALV